jgi:hypothetical protein
MLLGPTHPLEEARTWCSSRPMRTESLCGIVQRSFGLLQVLIGLLAFPRYRLILFQLLDLGSLTIDLALLR